MQRHVLRGGGIVVLLIAALLSAACGGEPAPTPPGYACLTGNYCATYIRFQSSDYTGNPSINGAYTYVQNTPMTCTGACLAAGPNQGYVARLLMLISDDNDNWVESGIWNSGYLGGSTKLFYGVGINGIPSYHAAPTSSSYNASDYGVGIEIQRYFAGGSNYGYAFRDVPWYGGPQTAVVPPAVQVSVPNADGLAAPTNVLTKVEFGEFLRGTSGATADDGNIDPPIVTSSLSGSTTLSPVVSGYPNNLYPYALHTTSAGVPFQFYHSSETLNSDHPPIATGSPPFGAFLYFSGGLFHWSATTSTDPASNLIFFTCCGGSFQ